MEKRTNVSLMRQKIELVLFLIVLMIPVIVVLFLATNNEAVKSGIKILSGSL